MKRIVIALSATLLFLTACTSTPAPASSVAPAAPESSSVAPAAPESSAPASSAPTASQSAETHVFTDSIGREVTLPADIQAIVPSGALSQLVLYSLAPDRMVGWTSKPTEGMIEYFDEKYISLPTFGTFYGKNADLNVEALLAAKPQVVIDIGEVKKNMAQDLDELQKQIGIPVVFIEATMDTMSDAYRTLGDLLNMADTAKPLADYCDATMTEVAKKAAEIPADKRVRIYYGDGSTGLQTNPKSSFHAETVALAGGENVADIEVIAGGSGGNVISMEQLLLWSPDVIIFDPGKAYEAVGTDPLWRDIPAIQTGKFYEIPDAPFNWIGRPPAVNRFLGIKWLANILYPDQFTYDMVAEAKTFYSLFYHYELTDEQANALMANSTFATR